MTDQDYTAQAQRHLAAHMAKLGQTHIAQRILEVAFADDVDPAVFSDDNEEDYIQEARERAREYCEARNKNLRPVRPVDPNNEAAVEGHRSALEFVERRRRSVIRK